MSLNDDSARYSVSLDFESLVARYYRSLYQFAFGLTRVEADACDLTQQTFYIWATKGHQLRDVTKVKTWLFTTLHREFLESRRRQKRFPHYELSQVVGVAGTVIIKTHETPVCPRQLAEPSQPFSTADSPG